MKKLSGADWRDKELAELFVFYCQRYNQEIVWGGASEEAFRKQYEKADLVELRKELTKKG